MNEGLIQVAAGSAEVFRDGNYWLGADGRVYRGADHIATIRPNGSVIYEVGMVCYKNRVGRLISAANRVAQEARGREEKPAAVAVTEVTEVEEPVVSAEVSGGEELELTDVMGDWPEGAVACDWRGDMTPQFVEWYFVNWPQRAKRRYAQRALTPVVQEVLEKLQIKL